MSFTLRTITTPLYKPFRLAPTAAATKNDWVQSLPPLPIKRPGSPIKILILYGSLRKRSTSRLLAFEFGRVLEHMGADVRIYTPDDLPLRNGNKLHPKVVELRDLSTWSDGQVWDKKITTLCFFHTHKDTLSPEQYGQISGVLKTQLDWIPSSYKNSDGDEIKPTQGKTLAVAQVHGGVDGFNAINTLRLMSRWVNMYPVSNQVCVFQPRDKFDDQGRMKPSFYRRRVVDVAEELYKLTALLGPQRDSLLDRYSERERKIAEKAEVDKLSNRAQNKDKEETQKLTLAMLEKAFSPKERN